MKRNSNILAWMYWNAFFFFFGKLTNEFNIEACLSMGFFSDVLRFLNRTGFFHLTKKKKLIASKFDIRLIGKMPVSSYLWNDLIKMILSWLCLQPFGMSCSTLANKLCLKERKKKMRLKFIETLRNVHHNTEEYLAQQ